MSVTIVRPDGRRLTLDATLREDWRPEILVTDHPIEDGGTTSDHAQPLPLLYTVEGIITETPYAGMGGISGPQRVRDARTFLEGCQAERLTVYSLRFGALSNMVLLRWPHSVDVVRRLPITLEFKQIRVAVAQAVQIAPLRPRVEARTGAPDEQDMGPQNAARDVGPNRDRDRSLALRGLQSMGLVE